MAWLRSPLAFSLPASTRMAGEPDELRIRLPHSSVGLPQTLAMQHFSADKAQVAGGDGALGQLSARIDAFLARTFLADIDDCECGVLTGYRYGGAGSGSTGYDYGYTPEADGLPRRWWGCGRGEIESDADGHDMAAGSGASASGWMAVALIMLLTVYAGVLVWDALATASVSNAFVLAFVALGAYGAYGQRLWPLLAFLAVHIGRTVALILYVATSLVPAILSDSPPVDSPVTHTDGAPCFLCLGLYALLVVGHALVAFLAFRLVIVVKRLIVNRKQCFA
ncbi:uncharacterized protein AMSG_09741 [Thecamonas trahens ATCC 50062]|uniref:Uncharacterized protein n=1 Tax=Thecamonas trahens ATCC 50062 TaxID=461836 RepID=A0A0L0DPZ9_THETB|nr:hypothetical protein AMSG_09741 [Thecamonas trahens ATCC 50062]KNC54076.1 hypothetical protein AMSG_09741 [Thecamonas trahens ATCC 50062]|eukprot:XP_013754085.1 hypothetical protein AMSG_09741 [Thecamonas trahens ATCC 50062]